MEPRLQNWENFCRYHARGNWHGTWTKYSPESEIIDSYRGIRSLLVTEDGSEVYHRNHYFYASGKSESQTFQVKKKPLTLSLFIDSSFSWGSTKRESGYGGDKFGYMYLDTWKWTPFFFEIGFSYEDRKVSGCGIYDDSSRLQYVTVITENLESFAEEPPRPLVSEGSGDWQGTVKTMTSDWIVSPAVATSWKRLENLAEDYFTLHSKEGVSVSCPRSIESGKEFFVAADWLVNPGLLQRGIRHYDTSGFTKFSLEVFNHNS